MGKIRKKWGGFLGTFSGKKMNKIDVGTVFCYHKFVIWYQAKWKSVTLRLWWFPGGVRIRAINGSWFYLYRYDSWMIFRTFVRNNRKWGKNEMWIANGWKEYEVIDTSCGEKLERWGKYLLVRPDPQVIWDTPKTEPGWRKMCIRDRISTEALSSCFWLSHTTSPVASLVTTIW